MRILTSLIVVAALSGCAYQSGYIDPQGVWIAKGETYAMGTCPSNAPFVLGPQGPTGARGAPGLAGGQGDPGIAGPIGPAGAAGAGGAGWCGRASSISMTGRGGNPAACGSSSMENVNFQYGSSALQVKCKEKLANFALWMQNNPRAQVSLDGHQSDADDRSPVLAVNRVTADQNEPIRLGAFILIASRSAPTGDRCRSATSTMDTCLELNRRVEILAGRSLRSSKQPLRASKLLAERVPQE